MSNIIKALKKVASFFLWHYRTVDKLRPDDSANQVMFLNLILHAMEAGTVYGLYLLFGKTLLSGG